MKNPKGMYAWTVTVGEKGQIVIPKQAREVLILLPATVLFCLGIKNEGLPYPSNPCLTILPMRFSRKTLRKNNACDR